MRQAKTIWLRQRIRRTKCGIIMFVLSIYIIMLVFIGVNASERKYCSEEKNNEIL